MRIDLRRPECLLRAAKGQALALLISAGSFAYALAPAEVPSVATPSAQPAPLLERINRETQLLFGSVKPGLVRVELPVPKWMAQLSDQDNLLNKYKLDPQVREKLSAERSNLSGQGGTLISPATQPAGAASTANGDGDPRRSATSDEQRRFQMTMVQRPDGSIEFVAPNAAPVDSVVGAIVAPRSVGIIYDDDGHIVIPAYIEGESIDDNHPLAVMGFGGGATHARFVGSDRQTNLTVLKLEAPLGRVASFAGHRPADGSLVMMLSSGGETGKLAIWTRGQQEHGLVVTVDGNVAGFARLGQFLDAGLARPVIDQLIQFGKVRRAMLGVLVTEAEAPDGRRAMHVDQVRESSAAQAAGLMEGDYILTLAGAPVDDLPNFAAAISARDGRTEMQVLRAGKTVTLTVELRPQ